MSFDALEVLKRFAEFGINESNGGPPIREAMQAASELIIKNEQLAQEVRDGLRWKENGGS